MGGEHRGISTDLLVVKQYEIRAGRIDSWSPMLCKNGALGIDSGLSLSMDPDGGVRANGCALSLSISTISMSTVAVGCVEIAAAVPGAENVRIIPASNAIRSNWSRCTSGTFQDANSAMLPAAMRTEYPSGADSDVRHPANRCRRDAYRVARSQCRERLARWRRFGRALHVSHIPTARLVSRTPYPDSNRYSAPRHFDRLLRARSRSLAERRPFHEVATRSLIQLRPEHQNRPAQDLCPRSQGTACKGAPDDAGIRSH